MSYCRFGNDSGAYVVHDGRNYLCVACTLSGDRSDVETASAAPMIAHLQAHQAAGHKVPKYAFKRLRQEARGRDRG